MNGKSYNEKILTIEKLNEYVEQGYSTLKIQKETGIPKSTVYEHLKRAGLKTKNKYNNQNFWRGSKKSLKSILEHLLKKGYSNKGIANVMNVYVDTISLWFRQTGLKANGVKRNYSYTKGQLQKAIIESSNIKEVCLKLNLAVNSSNYRRIIKQCKELSFDLPKRGHKLAVKMYQPHVDRTNY